nr:MAG TPA: Major capsid protein [Caudoviricetes sp.]
MYFKKFLMTILLLPVLPIIGVTGAGGSGASDDAQNDPNSDDNDNADQDKESDQDDSDDSEKGEKTFTQSEVNKMMSREKKQGRFALLKELGFKNVDDAKNFYAKYKSQEDASKTDEQKQNEVNLQNTELQNKLATAQAQVAAMKFGAKSEFVDDVITLALAKLDDENDDLNEIFGEIKTKHSYMFISKDEDEKGNAGKKGTGGSPSGKNSSGSEKENSLGARLAAAKKNNTIKSHYFTK